MSRVLVEDEWRKTVKKRVKMECRWSDSGMTVEENVNVWC